MFAVLLALRRKRRLRWRLSRQVRIRQLRGMLIWEGELDAMRRD